MPALSNERPNFFLVQKENSPARNPFQQAIDDLAFRLALEFPTNRNNTCRNIDWATHSGIVKWLLKSECDLGENLVYLRFCSAADVSCFHLDAIVLHLSKSCSFSKDKISTEFVIAVRITHVFVSHLVKQRQENLLAELYFAARFLIFRFPWWASR